MAPDGRVDGDPEEEDVGMDDEAAWEQAMADVKPLGDKTEESVEPDGESAPEAGLAERFRMRQDATPTVTGDTTFSFDRRTYERLKEGRIAIEGQIDLHGFTQEEAFTAVNTFLDEAWFEGRRCLLVITGKGTARDGGGVLRSAVPRWITEGAHRERLIGIGPADSRHGGDGALYVLLRRPRDPVIGSFGDSRTASAFRPSSSVGTGRYGAPWPTALKQPSRTPRGLPPRRRGPSAGRCGTSSARTSSDAGNSLARS